MVGRLRSVVQGVTSLVNSGKSTTRQRRSSRVVEAGLPSRVESILRRHGAYPPNGSMAGGRSKYSRQHEASLGAESDASEIQPNGSTPSGNPMPSGWGLRFKGLIRKSHSREE